MIYLFKLVHHSHQIRREEYTLWRHHIEAGKGIYTDMNALRPHEELDNIHSIYVDQWDWEKVMAEDERTVEYLYDTVKCIYKALKHTEYLLSEQYPVFTPFLPEEITFVHAEELRREYPNLSPKEREYEACRKYGAVFVPQTMTTGLPLLPTVLRDSTETSSSTTLFLAVHLRYHLWE